MPTIVLFGGTTEGRLLAEAFCDTKLNLHICVATAYGAALLPHASNLTIHAGRMDEKEMESFLSAHPADYCLDATHPYAVEATANIRKSCEKKEVKYLRVLRGEEEAGEKPFGDHPDFYEVENVEAAVSFLKETTGKILITTGSRDLEKYTKLPDYANRCVARVLPLSDVLEKCEQLGFAGKNLIGMQGPFDEDINYSMLKQVNAKWLVTKRSGKEGGFAEKCKGALRAGAKIVAIGRADETKMRDAEETETVSNVMSLSEAISFLEDTYQCQANKRTAYLIGMGVGDEVFLTGEAKKCLEDCDVLIGAERILKICPEYEKKPSFCSYNKDEIKEYLGIHPEYRKAALLFSGDIGFYSGARQMRDCLDGFQIRSVSGISSVQHFLNRLGIPWSETVLLSCHGREKKVIPLIRENRWVCALMGGEDTLAEIGKRLTDFGMDKIKVTVGECLSYPEEKITTGFAKDFAEKRINPLSVVLFENEALEDEALESDTSSYPDDAFLRGNVPMTKEEIRTVSVAKLGLAKDSVLYDVGAGTGSVSVEAARRCPSGMVYAVERGEEACRLISENQKKFQAENLELVFGEAPECLENLPAPTHVFIGGSGGKLAEIIAAVRQKNPDAVFVINAVTLETLSALEEISREFPEYQDMEMVQINVARSRKLGGYHLMQAENPVTIAKFGGKGKTNGR